MFLDPRTGPLRLSAVYYLKTDLTMAINCGLRRKNRYDCQDRPKSAICSSIPTFGPTPATPRSGPGWARDGRHGDGLDGLRGWPAPGRGITRTGHAVEAPGQANGLS
jgi:hypothetical protein